MTFDEADTIREKRLCPVCMGVMEKDGYLIRPTRQQQRNRLLDIWERGICDGCGRERKMTKKRWYLPKFEWFEERGMI